MKVEFEGVLYVNGTPTTPYYSLNIAQKTKQGEDYFYVNIFFKEDVIIPENSTKIRGAGIGKLFKDKRSGVTRISISNAEIYEDLGKFVKPEEVEANPYLFEDDTVKIDDNFFDDAPKKEEDNSDLFNFDDNNFLD